MALNKKQKKNLKFFGMLSFVLLVIIGISIGVYTGVFQEGISQGFSTMSLSSVDLQSDFAPLSGKAWVMTFRLGGLSQYAVASDSVTPDEVKTKYSTSTFTSESFRVDTKLDEQSCFYNIRADSTATPVYKLTFAEWNEFGSCSWDTTAYSKCGSAVPIAGYTEAFDISGKCNVICATKVAEKYFFDSPQVNSKFTVSVGKNNVVTDSKSFQTLFSDDKAFDIQGMVGSNVYIIWQGDMSSGRSCPTTSNVVPVYYNGNFKTVSESHYSDYKIAFNVLGISTVAGGLKQLSSGSSDATIENYIANINSKADLIMNGQAYVNSGQSVVNGQLKVPLTTAITYPTLTAYIKASWVGIVTPVGKPQITGLSSTCFTSGTSGADGTGNVNIDIKNVGGQREQFSIQTTCPAPFKTENSDIFLNAGESGSRILKISGATNNRETRQECSVSVKGLTSTDTKTFSACVQAPKICEASKGYCQGNVIKYCNADGTGYDETSTKTCDKGCEYQGGVPTCVQGSGCVASSVSCVDGSKIMKCSILGKYDTMVQDCYPSKCLYDGDKPICESNNNKTCPAKFGGLVQGTRGIVENCGILCSVTNGFIKPTQTETCIYDYTMLYIVLAVLIGIVIIVLMKSKPKNKGKGGKKNPPIFTFSTIDNATLIKILSFLGISAFVVYFWMFQRAWFFVFLIIGILSFFLYLKFFRPKGG